MTTSVQNVVAGKPLATGGVWRGDIDATLPTNATTALDNTLKGLGYVGEDGLTETVERSTEKIVAWGGDVVKVVQTETSVTYTFTLIEALRGGVLEAVHGKDNVTTVGSLTTVKVTGEMLPQERYVFEVRDGKARIRIVVPLGQITEVGEVTYTDGEVVGFPVTVEAFHDPTLNAKAVKYIDTGDES